jgi:hypothetical protein
MRYDSMDSALVSAFKIVGTYDPATLARMRADKRWIVTSDMSQFPDRDGGNLGVTYSDVANETRTAITGVNYDAVNEQAEAISVEPIDLLAAVLVHEYAHAHQTAQQVSKLSTSEVPAFKVGTAFARKLPEPDGPLIARLSEKTCEHMTQDSAYRAQEARNSASVSTTNQGG